MYIRYIVGGHNKITVYQVPSRPCKVSTDNVGEVLDGCS